jgi:hypothetical protein
VEQQNRKAWQQMKTFMIVATVVAVVNVLGISYSEGSTVVVKSDPLWTNTALTLNIGDTVTITASGSWQFDTSSGSVGPNGVVHPGGEYDVFYSAALHGALIAYIGADPYQGHWGDGSFFPQATGYRNIGTSALFTSDKAGKLWLGMNDDAVGQGTYDNSGSVTAQISVQPVPEPNCFTLVLMGAGALIGSRRILCR